MGIAEELRGTPGRRAGGGAGDRSETSPGGERGSCAREARKAECEACSVSAGGWKMPLDVQGVHGLLSGKLPNGLGRKLAANGYEDRHLPRGAQPSEPFGPTGTSIPLADIHTESNRFGIQSSDKTDFLSTYGNIR